MVSAMKSVLAVAIIASVACTGYAIQCYSCDSLRDPKCGAKFESQDNFKIDCSRVAPPNWLQTYFSFGNATGCMKKQFDSVTGTPQVVRQCFFGDISHTESGCKPDPALAFIKQLSCDVCKGDLCNGSSVTAPIAAAIAIFFVLARLMA